MLEHGRLDHHACPSAAAEQLCSSRDRLPNGTFDPRAYIATMSKAKRRGKIFVDYLRNQRGATAIASYSSRSRPGATVATPLAWSELTARLDPKKFTVETIPVRLKKLRTDPWADLSKIKQSLTAKMLAAID
jgi:bifunctional non-homologous end joining protein LigD